MLSKCASILQSKIHSTKHISGGDINEARLLETSTGNYFLKFNESANFPSMFPVEALGLKRLGSASIIQTPKVIHAEESFLLLEYIEPAPATPAFWKNFGIQLAQLHQQTHTQFGLDHDNFIGRLPQANNFHDNWPSFYIQERLQPQLQLAIDKKQLTHDFILKFENLYSKLDQLCPREAPALTHGDLWSGNFMATADDKPVLIDPAVSYAHREMDLAMSKLFGGFTSLFYDSYFDAYPWEAGLEERIPVYQLYYLIVHVNLFGGGYVGSVERILKKYS